MVKRLALIVAVLYPSLVMAQPGVGIPPTSLLPPMIPIFASAVNGSGQSTTGINIPAGQCFSINSDTYLCRAASGRFIIGTTNGATNGVLASGDGTASAPSLTFASEPDFGFYRAGTRSLVLAGAAGTRLTAFGSAGIIFRNSDSLNWSSTSDSLGTPDLSLWRDGSPNSLAQRNGTNAQTFNLYNTFTDTSNYQRVQILGNYTGNNPGIFAQGAGTGGTGQILYLAGQGGVYIATAGGSATWQFTSSGNLADTGSHSITAGSTVSGSKHISATAAPSLSSCGTGTIDANSTDFAGKVTATGATACTVTFTSAYPTAAWCVITDDTTIGKGLISAQSASAFTVSSLTSGDTFTYLCGGK